jgi:prepilin-type N-terminal cleavage/methylation domain-containing protein
MKSLLLEGNDMNPQRQGLSLLEVVIAISLFSLVMVAVLQATISTTNYADFDTARSNQQADTIRLQNRILNDFANAAWFYQFDFLAMKLAVDPATNRRIPLFPAINSDGTTIEFIKLRSSLKTDSNPANERYTYTNFRSNASRPVDFNRYVDAFPTPFMVVNKDYVADPQWFVAPVWESDRAGLTFSENLDPDNLRHYLYVVEPNSRGTKSLVRKYRNGFTDASTGSPSAWAHDEVLIDEVKEVRFEVFDPDKTNQTLTENQVRFIIVLEHEGQGMTANTGAKILRRIDFTAAMRSINQEN